MKSTGRSRFPAHQDVPGHGHDLATARGFSVIEQGFEPGIDLLLETGKSSTCPELRRSWHR